MTSSIECGNRITKVSGSVTTRTFLPHYEEENGIAIKHYSFNGMAIAVRKGTTLNYVHSDHLGSSSVETNSSGAQSASRTYYAYGSTRSSSGTLQTDRTFTGQKADGTGLLIPGMGQAISPRQSGCGSFPESVLPKTDSDLYSAHKHKG